MKHRRILLDALFVFVCLVSVSSEAQLATSASVIEFYNASLDHYFITWEPDEIAKLDAGVEIKGWERTGYAFDVYTSLQAGTVPVCRYYIPPRLGDSHFFGRDVVECDATGQKFPSFVLEDPTFMHVLLPAAGSQDYLRASHSGIRPWDGPAGSQDYLRASHSGIRPWDGPAGSQDYLRASHSGIRPWDGPAGSQDYLRASHSGIRPWDGPAGSQDYLRASHSGIRPWDGPAGSCPDNTTPVYRVFSNRADANHRYMTDRNVRDQMAAKGWLVEGDGSDAVVMCAPGAKRLACDDSMKLLFKPDANTTVTLVQAFSKGDPLALGGTPFEPAPPLAPNDLCLVKLNVGPGNPGQDEAPSTSKGIGIEIWLPASANWSRRLHLLGGSGWQGGTDISSIDTIGGVAAAFIAGSENAVSAVTDTGHTVWQNGSFAMNADGSINTALWNDFARRAVHEMAVKTKALATDYYRTAPRASYFDGCSTGGRQGLMQAQAYPEDFDGILAGAPAIYWSRLAVADLYPQVVMNLDAGGPIALAKQNLAALASIKACDSSLTGAHDGYVDDPAACAYDPASDPDILCVGSGGNNTSTACLSQQEAQAINKIWYGQTADGSVPAPAIDNGYHATLSPTQLWYGLTRGTNPELLAAGQAFSIATDQVALSLQNPAYASPTFTNATGNGTDRWKALAYAGPESLATALLQGAALNDAFGGVDTDIADLSGFRDRGGKLLTYHGLADQLVPPQGSIHYYSRVAATMGGIDNMQQFDRLFLIPGMGHCAGVGSLDTGNPPANPPLPAAGQLFDVLTDWVEKGIMPATIVVSTGVGTPRSRPLCMFPLQRNYLGGDVNDAASFRCE